MWQYIVRRLLLMIPTFFLITGITFFIMQMAPGGPLEAKMRSQGSSLGGSSGGEGSSVSAVTEEAKEAIKKLYGFDKPIYERYILWVRDILSLNFGESLFEYRPVSTMIWERMLVALLFGVASTFMAYLVSIILGVLKAIYQDTFFDRATTFLTFVGYSIPTVVSGLILILLFSVHWDIFPVVGLYSDEYESLSRWEKIKDVGLHFVLPFSAYVVGQFAFLTELQKDSMLSELGKDYIRTARAKGLSEKTVYFKHAFRNALIPIVTSLRSVLITFLGSSFIIETIFTIPGLGNLGYSALLVRDYPVIMANLTITAILGMFSMLLTDILYTIVDPRIDFD